MSSIDDPLAHFQLGAVSVEVTSDLVTTTMPDGAIVFGAPHSTAEYLQTAQDHGYGDDVARMNRCHEIMHSMLAHMLGLKCSPTLARVSKGLMEPTEITRAEETAVLAVERYANVIGVTLDQPKTTPPIRNQNPARAAYGNERNAASVWIMSKKEHLT